MRSTVSALTRQMMLQYEANINEAPLHTLQRVVSVFSSAADVVSRYWARMAYVDVGHRQAHNVFLS
jgi:hypothetical protein